ncbi:alpha/beta fold hydrolase [Protaetiibacter intestinalis]|uniref:Alpha/beta hydrolase n=1 Tax=Protaetiibacter intestinalis TaxID=2419774 RepID=A0A387B7I1_9MICO|nr:alpha/beta hydrolase [Protaetiibacter intestinalis]AYF99622.1 alpha/beta hydrolase [Protaetiibacter intestinalis]
MTPLDDLFPGYDSVVVPTSAGAISARVGGSGSPVLLIHGHPQTGVMYHRLAPRLAVSHTVVVPDLPGYGESEAREPDAAHGPYDKRSMGNALVEVMHSLGHDRFAVIGHDRGGRVAYRLTLDHPENVTKLSVLDIVPTLEVWDSWDRERGMQLYHWTMLAQQSPIPETLLKDSSVDWLNLILSWGTTGTFGDYSVFDERALDHYRAFIRQPDRIRAICEDYRAGATTDTEHDEADRAAGKMIQAPVLVLWGVRGVPANHDVTPVDIWRRWAVDVRGEALRCGHFLPEEAPEATAEPLLRFLSD